MTFLLSPLRWVGAGVALTAALSACTPDPPPYSSLQLSFTFPPLTAEQAQPLMLAAYYYDGTTPKLLQHVSLDNHGQGAPVSSATMNFYSLSTLAPGSACLSPFVGGETKNRLDVSVTPSTVNTCNVYFSVYADTGQHLPTLSSEKFMTNDFLSYASSDFSYHFVSPDGKSSESGNRQAGWTLVRHFVVQPSSTPGHYLVSMNSVPEADQAIPIKLHAPSDGLISMSLGGLK